MSIRCGHFWVQAYDPTTICFYDPVTGTIHCLSDDPVTSKLSNTMPWIGLYVATASLACLILVLFDVVSALRSRRLWIPCNLFALNAVSLTILAVAMKMPLDINTHMQVPTDELTKLSSTMLMCISIVFFMPSLGAMKDGEIITNLIAMGILVITVIVNICIQLAAEAARDLQVEQITVTILMFLLFVLSILSALAIGTTKKDLGLRYTRVFKREKVKKMTVHELEFYVKKYRMLAESGSPQFVMARSVFCVASNLICLLAATFLAEAEIRLYWPSFTEYFLVTQSDYSWSTVLIVGIQSIAIYVGVIAIFLRWFSAVKLNFPKNGIRSYKVFKVEDYWTERLVELKESPLPLKIRGPKSKKFLEHKKRVFLQFVIKVQIAAVVACKFLCLLSIFVVRVCCRKHVRQPRDSNNQEVATDPATPHEQGCARYTLNLEGEEDMDEMILRRLNKEAELLITKGRRNQPKNLLELLKKSMDFNWVIEFGRDRVLSLDTEGPLPNCWSLSVVTLTSIAIATCKVNRSQADPLIRAVSESLVYVNLVEKCLDANGNVANGVTEASKAIWYKVEVYSKWLDQDLQKVTVVTLADEAKRIVTDYEAIDECLNENNSQLRIKVVAASSMFKICTSLQLENETGSELTHDKMFEKLSSMIAGILGACLTNLCRVIAIKCHSNVIDQREESVKLAAQLLGETEEILKFLDQNELFCIDNDQVASIDDWRANIARVGGVDHSVVSSSDERTEVVLEPDRT